MNKHVCTILVLLAAALCSARAAEDVLLVKGERLQADVTGGAGTWNIGRNVSANEVLVIRFAPAPPPAYMASGVFLRGGSLVCGTLVSLVGDAAEISSIALGALKVKREDVAAAFYPLPAGQSENLPELASYAELLSATLGSYQARFVPGQRSRVCFFGADAMTADRIMRVDSENVLVAAPNQSVEKLNRQFVRMLELKVAAAPPSPPEDARLGPEVIVRLKGGDLLRGRVVKLTDKALTLHTSFMGDVVLERGFLAALFLAGGKDSGITWLSAVKPVRAVHVPLFDAEYPPRADVSVDGHNLLIGNVPCERGLGVHSRSELEFALEPVPQYFISICGIDAETKGRGEVLASVTADGKELWHSATITGHSDPALLALDLGVARQLVLKVDFGPGQDDSGGHFDWGWAAVVTKR